MAEKWYSSLPGGGHEPEEERHYREAVGKIRDGIAKGLDFEAACAAVDSVDKELRLQIIDDTLKVIIAEEHFARKVSLEDLASRLALGVERLRSAKEEMLEEVAKTSAETLHKGFGSVEH